MKHFIVEITYRIPVEELGEVLPLHRAFLKNGYESGMLLCSGPQNPRVGGMVIARAADQAEIQAFFDQDPYHLRGVASHRIIEFEPVLRQQFMEEWINS